MKSLKVFIYCTVILLAMFVFINTSNAVGDINIYIDEVEVNFNDVVGYPVIANGRTSVPVRIISENMGYEVDWNAENRIVSISNSSDEIKLTIDSLKATVNGKDTTIDSKAYISNSRTYVPIRFISETLGAEVRYSKENGTSIIKIYTGKPGIVIPPKEELKPVESKDWIKPNFLPVKYGNPQIPVKLYVENYDDFKGSGAKVTPSIIGDFAHLNKYTTESIFEIGKRNTYESKNYKNGDPSKFQHIYQLYLPPGAKTIDGKEIKMPKAGDVITIKVMMTQNGETKEYTVPFEF